MSHAKLQLPLLGMQQHHYEERAEMLCLRRAGAWGEEKLLHGLADETRQNRIGQKQVRAPKGRRACCFPRRTEMTHPVRPRLTSFLRGCDHIPITAVIGYSFLTSRRWFSIEKVSCDTPNTLRCLSGG